MAAAHKNTHACGAHLLFAPLESSLKTLPGTWTTELHQQGHHYWLQLWTQATSAWKGTTSRRGSSGKMWNHRSAQRKWSLSIYSEIRLLWKLQQERAQDKDGSGTHGMRALGHMGGGAWAPAEAEDTLRRCPLLRHRPLWRSVHVDHGSTPAQNSRLLRCVKISQLQSSSPISPMHFGYYTKGEAFRRSSWSIFCWPL